MGRRIAMTVTLAAFVAAVAWAAPASAGYNPNSVFVGTSTSAVDPCGSTTVAGSGFQPDEFVTLSLDGSTLGIAATGATGSFSTTVTIPAGTNPGTYTLISTGGPGYGAFTSLTVGLGGCHLTPHLTHSTLDPGGSTRVHGDGCPADDQVTLTLDGIVVGTTTANSDGAFSASIIPHGYKIGQETVTVTCGTRTFGVLLSVVSTSVIKTPESTTAVFGVFVLLGLVLFWGQLNTRGKRRRRHQGS